MAMSNAAALTKTAQRKLKSLAADAISIPTTEELYARKSEELRDARRRLNDIVKRQIAIETNRSRSAGDNTAILAEKAKATAAVERLENEGGLLKAELVAQRPKPPLTPQQQFWVDALNYSDPYEKCKRGSPEKIAAARKVVDEMVREYRFSPPAGGNAHDAFAAKLNAARTRLTALEGPPYPPYHPWASPETLKAARKAEGLE